jgi:hypothetical protein
MTDATYYSVALLLVAIPAWAVISGKALGVWRWRTMITRQYEPAVYWFVVAGQLDIFILFLLTGRSWHLR